MPNLSVQFCELFIPPYECIELLKHAFCDMFCFVLLQFVIIDVQSLEPTVRGNHLSLLKKKGKIRTTKDV